MLLADTTINKGGLMRCCLETIHEYRGEHGAEKAPLKLVISCAYEADGNSGNIILEEDVWRWNYATREE